MTNPSYSLDTVAIAHTPFDEKFAVPRQPGLTPSAICQIVMQTPYNREEYVRGLDGFSHIWLSFVFHECVDQGFKPMVRPPRLGGNEKVGVFASRSPFRPNNIGLSVVELVNIEIINNQVTLNVRGADLVNNTPIVDIKPYVPYADAIHHAQGGFAPTPPTIVSVNFSDEATAKLQQIDNAENMRQLISEVLGLKPQPAYQRSDREYGVKLGGYNIRWCWDGSKNTVTSITPLQV